MSNREPVVGGSGAWPLHGEPGNRLAERETPPILDGFDAHTGRLLRDTAATCRDLAGLLDKAVALLVEASAKAEWRDTGDGQYYWEPSFWRRGEHVHAAAQLLDEAVESETTVRRSVRELDVLVKLVARLYTDAITPTSRHGRR